MAKRAVGWCKAVHATFELARESSANAAQVCVIDNRVGALRQQEWYRERRFKAFRLLEKRWKAFILPY